MTYEDAMDAETIVSHEEAYNEVKYHDADWGLFIEVFGQEEEYKACDVLSWLGY